MRRILKWTVPVDDQPHQIGAGPVVHVACQYGPESVQVWTDEDEITEAFEPQWAQVYGTGQPLPHLGDIAGTAVTANGSLVWHVVLVETPQEAA